MKGNASRTEYNIYLLFLILFLAFSMYFLYVISIIFPDLEMLGVYYIWYFAYAIFMLISGIALTLRRLNDLKMGRSTIIVLFIPIIGFIGSAWATLVCYFCMAVSSYFLGRKHYKIPYPLKRIFFYL